MLEPVFFLAESLIYRHTSRIIRFEAAIYNIDILIRRYVLAWLLQAIISYTSRYSPRFVPILVLHFRCHIRNVWLDFSSFNSDSLPEMYREGRETSITCYESHLDVYYLLGGFPPPPLSNLTSNLMNFWTRYTETARNMKNVVSEFVSRNRFFSSGPVVVLNRWQTMAPSRNENYSFFLHLFSSIDATFGEYFTERRMLWRGNLFFRISYFYKMAWAKIHYTYMDR